MQPNKTQSFNSDLFAPPSRQSLLGQPVLHSSIGRQRLDRYFHSAYSKAFYSVMLIVTLFSICWSLTKWPKYADSNWFRGLEVCVILLFLLDYGLRLWWMTLRYCLRLGNLLDLLVQVISLFSLITEIQGTVEAAMGDVGTAVMVLLRSVLQFMRVIQLIKYSRSTHDPAQANLLGTNRVGVEQETDDEGTDV